MPFYVPVRYLKRLNIASRVVSYYNSVRRELAVENIGWTVMDNFNFQRKALKDKSKETVLNVPKLLPYRTVSKCNDAINIHTSQVFGDRKSNLSCIIQEDVAVPEVAPPLLLNRPHSVEANSIQAEMTTCLSNNHPLFQNDNTSFYGILEEAVRRNIYEATINPLQRTHDVHGDYK